MELTSTEIWTIIGVLLLVIEIFAVSFFFLFFGIGALATALLSWIGVLDSITAQLLVFIVVSAASILIFRKKLKLSFDKRSEGFNEFEGEKVKVVEAILPNEEGKVSFRGAHWIAYSSPTETLSEGTHAIIKKVEGIKLFVEKA